ncbi:MAG TPA: ABC transporter substrate-binding protein, partial [Ktedonobacteraceae bacterium]|nr:ABC transporter substrate-binding protein [Ktedonobacteraceae bacterium]
MTHNAFFAQRKKAGMMSLSLLLLLSVVLAACGGSSSTTTHQRPAHPNSLTLLQNETNAYTQNFNPYSPGVIGGTPGLIYETLLYVNRLDGTVKPWLASSYDLASDAQSITFHLRQGVKWSDGQ